MDPAQSNAPAEQTLSQSEVEAVLAQVENAEMASAGVVVPEQPGQPHSKSVERHDFRKPSFLSPGELRKLRLRHEAFITSLAAQLSTSLRLEFGLQMRRLETISFRKFVEGLANPTHLTSFKLEPLEGVCYLEIPPKIALAMVDRLTGGPGTCSDATRDLSQIEIGLLEEPTGIILSEWCSLWGGKLELRTGILGHENNGRFLPVSCPDQVMLVLSMEARIAESVEQMQIGVSLATLRPLVETLNPGSAADKKTAEALAVVKPKWNSALNDVHIRVDATLPEIGMTAKEIAQLQVGDVLPLAAGIATRIQVRLAREPKFIGELGRSGESWAVRLSGRPKSLA